MSSARIYAANIFLAHLEIFRLFFSTDSRSELGRQSLVVKGHTTTHSILLLKNCFKIFILIVAYQHEIGLKTALLGFI